MTKKYINIIIIISVIAIGFLIFLYYNEITWGKYKNNEAHIIRDLKLTNDEGNVINITDLLTITPIIVFRFSELNCDICVDSEVERLERYSGKLGNNLLFIVTYSSDRYLKIFKRINHIEFPIYNLLNGEINIEVEKMNTPYYFILDKDLKVHDIFIPNKIKPEITEEYLRVVAERYSFDRK